MEVNRSVGLPSSAIRRMEYRDAGEVASLCGELSYPATTERILERLVAVQTSPPQQQADILVAVDPVGDRVVGWVHVCDPLFLTGNRSASVWGLVVTSACRGQGISRLLMEAAEEWAVDNGCKEMRLHSAVQRVEAHAFYERLGYRLEKSQLALVRSLPSTRTGA